MDETINLHKAERVIRFGLGAFMVYRGIVKGRLLSIIGGLPLAASAISGHCSAYEKLGVATEPYPIASGSRSFGKVYVDWLNFLLGKGELLTDDLLARGEHIKDDLLDKGTHLKEDLVDRGTHLQEIVAQTASALKEKLLDT